MITFLTKDQSKQLSNLNTDLYKYVECYGKNGNTEGIVISDNAFSDPVFKDHKSLLDTFNVVWEDELPGEM